jgi:hypothetical protein
MGRLILRPLPVLSSIPGIEAYVGKSRGSESTLTWPPGLCHTSCCREMAIEARSSNVGKSARTIVTLVSMGCVALQLHLTRDRMCDSVCCISCHGTQRQKTWRGERGSTSTSVGQRQRCPSRSEKHLRLINRASTTFGASMRLSSAMGSGRAVKRE